MNITPPRVVGAIALMILALRISPAGALAPAGRYTTAGTGTTGTVTDNKTKLIWQQTLAPGTYTWANAKTYCAGVGAVLGGTGWRLPTMKELFTLVDLSRDLPGIDTTVFPDGPLGDCWSSTPAAGAPSTNAWEVSIYYSFSAISFTTSSYYVRCVR